MHKTLSLGYTRAETEDCKKNFFQKWGLYIRGYTPGIYVIKNPCRDLVFSTPKTTIGDTFDGCKVYNRNYKAMANLSFSEVYRILGDNSTNKLPTTQVLSCSSGPYDWNIGAGMDLSLANEVNKSRLYCRFS